jgi:hypothetical protein
MNNPEALIKSIKKKKKKFFLLNHFKKKLDNRLVDV